MHDETAMFCEHANECPAECSCPLNCYCKVITCKALPVPHRTYLPPWWLHNGVEMQQGDKLRVVRAVHYGPSRDATIVRLLDQETGASEYLSCTSVETEWKQTGKRYGSLLPRCKTTL